VLAYALVGVVRPFIVGRSTMPFDSMRSAVFFPFLFGLLSHRYASGQCSRRVLYTWVSLLGASVVLVWGVNYLLFPMATTTKQLVKFSLIWGLAFASFLFLLEARHRPTPTFAAWLGRRSYPIYLLHPFVLVVLSSTGWSALWFMPSLIGLTLLLAALAHRFIERPGIALGRWIEKKWTSTTAAASADSSSRLVRRSTPTPAALAEAA
jgi:peptidoglycan/LPS O-acetylase OafA/YrhL